MKFMTVSQAKAHFGTTTFNVKLNANTGKKSILLPNGKFLKIQQDLNPKLEMAWMWDADGDIEDGCLVNVDRTSPLSDIMDI